MAQATSTLWAQTIPLGGTVHEYVEVWDAAARVATLSPTAGGVTAIFATGIRRTLDATFDPSAVEFLVPGVELRPYCGFNFGYGPPEVLPLGRFPLSARSVSIRETDLQVTCQDRWQWVVQTTFLTPWTAKAGVKIKDLISQLIIDTGQWSTVTNTVSSNAVAATQTWDTDRSQAIADLCKSVGAEAFPARDGSIVVRDRKAAGIPVATISDGFIGNGKLVDLVETVDTSNVFNVVVAVGNTTDPALTFDPVMVRISDPAHPAYPAPGKMTTRVKRIDSAQFASPAQAKAAAQKVLTQVSAKARQLSLVVMADPALDEADTLTVVWPDGTSELAQIQQITYPLTVADDQQITTVSTRSDEDFTP